MTREELLAKLDARQALIVHFSAHAVMRDGLEYPTDLQQVLAEKEQWPLSCSVLTPGHHMDVTGSVGVILKPRTTEDVLRVHHDDAGAYDVAGANQSRGVPLSDSAFDASIDDTVPGAYNEWRVRGAKPVGIFVLDPASVSGPPEIHRARTIRRRGSYRGWPNIAQCGPRRVSRSANLDNDPGRTASALKADAHPHLRRPWQIMLAGRIALGTHLNSFGSSASCSRRRLAYFKLRTITAGTVERSLKSPSHRHSRS